MYNVLYISRYGCSSELLSLTLNLSLMAAFIRTEILKMYFDSFWTFHRRRRYVCQPHDDNMQRIDDLYHFICILFSCQC